jgi:hypothetical protein
MQTTVNDDDVSSARRRRRPEPSGLQKRVGAAVLLGLLAIAAGILASQSRFNPAVTQFLASAAPTAAAPARTGPLIHPLPEGLAVLSPVERFDRETLSDKIDGKAELYLSAGFASLESQRFSAVGGPERWIEVYVYDMAAPANAFAVFSSQRRPGVESLDIAESAYRAENAVFLASGPFYVEIIASEKEASLAGLALALANRFLEARPAEASVASEKDLFPPEGRLADEIRLIPADAFGMAGLDRVYTATYRLNGAELTAFLSRRASAQEAAGWVQNYTDFLKDYGGEAIPTDRPAAGASLVAILDFYEVVFSRGEFLAGVHEAADREQALALAERLFEHLKEPRGAP